MGEVGHGTSRAIQSQWINKENTTLDQQQSPGQPGLYECSSMNRDDSSTCYNVDVVYQVENHYTLNQ